ncbi:J domain-containing protein DDB_G0295729-like isoform X1 [Cataglyphis hispanica]|uniref:J domain-containing protein DDB_G0295729-like isoform X1 n=1 Tax=Cataglyphis hispanica TaxID=1086592 RepID=UPI00217FC360|nr:J domain-containing protein DDB_G0295729-like isoform X1 [Cataglyphis hispanica]
MDGWKSWKRSESWFLSAWYQRVRESYVAAWFFGVFQNNRTMSTSTAPGGGGGGGVGGALSLMGCVREASPPPQNHHPHHHYHHHHHHHQQQQQQQHRAFGLGEFPAVQHSIDPVPKEPKKRRFHPLRGLRKIFRRKSRGAADARLVSNSGDRDAELAHLPREEITMRHPAGRPEEVRSRSASELLTDACDRESVFLRRGGVQDNFVKLRGGAGKLSVSHDSVFPGEVPHTRPLSSLASLTTLERRQTRKSNEIIEHKEYNHHAAQRHRISLRVLEQIKTVIENRNQLASATSTETASIAHTVGERYQQETTENRFAVFDKHGERSSAEECQQAKITRSTKDTVDRTVLVAKEDLPQLESVSLNHTAAHHRISVRPKNRRPPRRTVPTTTSSDVGFSNSSSIPPTIVEDTLDSLEQQKQEQQKQEQQLSQSTTNNGSLSPTEPPSKTVGVIRKSSSRLSRNSDIFEELESRLPRKTSATSLSPDSLDVTTMSQSSAEIATTEEQQQPEIKWITRKPSNRISKGSDVFEELEAKLPRRRSSSNRLSKSPDSLDSAPGCWFSKSTDEAFDKLVEYDEIAKPVASVRRPLLNPISKSTDRVSKSSDSLEAIEPLVSDDSIERRRSFDFRVHKSSKLISKSSENFDVLEQSTCIETEIGQELQKRSSVSDINLSRRRLSKSISKSSESFERIDMSDMKDDVDVEVLLEDDAPKAGGRRTKRMSSESSDNLDGEDRLENRRVRRMPKRMPSTSIVDMIISGDDHERERRPTPTRKPSRLQKSSESSELGSTDTLDSERRNKSSESTETLDSLEKDLEQDRKDEEITDSVDKREKNDSWSSRNVAITDSDQASMGDDTEDSKSLISADNKYYWRQSSEPASKENLGIQQLLAITIMTRMADNGNNQRGSYPKKRQQMSTSQPSSPVAKQEDTKMLFDNLLVNSKNDEDLQNMLNGNISEVSTDTKSFKEKLIMFEKLGK